MFWTIRDRNDNDKLLAIAVSEDHADLLADVFGEELSTGISIASVRDKGELEDLL